MANNVLEVFFDYACPYCLMGHKNLVELIPQYPDIQIKWCPCEAHPRPEVYGPHSDLCIQGYYYACEHGVDLWAYHNRMFDAVHKDRINIESIEALTDYVADLVEKEGFRSALKNRLYQSIQLESNDYAYEQSGVWAVPSYRMNEMKLDAIEGIGVTKEQLNKFLKTGSIEAHS